MGRSFDVLVYLVTCVNKAMPRWNQTRNKKIWMNRQTAGIQSFVEANLLETYIKVWVSILQSTCYLTYLVLCK